MATLSFFQAVILGLVQGLAEFLPISSSGHLALLQHFFHIEGDSVLIFAVMLKFMQPVQSFSETAVVDADGCFAASLQKSSLRLCQIKLVFN